MVFDTPTIVIMCLAVLLAVALFLRRLQQQKRR
jgi:hypothetical protein